MDIYKIPSHGLQIHRVTNPDSIIRGHVFTIRTVFNESGLAITVALDPEETVLKEGVYPMKLIEEQPEKIPQYFGMTHLNRGQNRDIEVCWLNCDKKSFDKSTVYYE